DPADEAALVVEVRLRVLAEDVADTADEALAEHALDPAEDVVVVDDLRHVLQRSHNRGIREGQLAGEERLVLRGTCGSDVDALEPVCEDPLALVRTVTDCPRDLALRLQRLREREQGLPRLRRLQVVLLEGLRSVPDDALRVRLRRQAVELPADRAEAEP